MTQEQCSSGSCGCGAEGCGCENMDFYDVMESRLMQMTFAAHKSVLFDKIVERIKKEEGAKLDAIADLLVEASKNEWKTEQEIKKKRDELREKLKETFQE